MTIRKAAVCIIAFGSLALTACTPSPPTSAKTAPGSGVGATTTTLTTSARLLAEAQQFAYRVRNVNCDATGSSFATAEGIITNRHVASGSTSLELSTWSGNDFNATVQSISQMQGPDLAILNGGSTQNPATLNATDVPAGTQVWAAGYPEGNQLSLTPGIVLDYISGSVYGVPGSVMELTNAIQPGNSGSPLLDTQGNVVGVVFALGTATGSGLAIPVSALTNYLGAPGSDTSGQCMP
jgi:S1-C subfamily serine protease